MPNHDWLRSTRQWQDELQCRPKEWYEVSFSSFDTNRGWFDFTGRPTNWSLDDYCHNKETYTNNTCVTHSHQAFEYDMFKKEDLAEYGPHNTTMPFTARNKHYLGVDFKFQGLWTHDEAVAHGVDVGGEVHPEMNSGQLAKAARTLLGLD